MKIYHKEVVISIALFAKFISADGTCLPLTLDGGLCAVAPGTTSSDGHDDVCVLAQCCAGSGGAAVETPTGSLITCAEVNCTSVCNLSIARSGFGNEACDNTCIPPSPPAPPNYTCLSSFVNTIIALIPGVKFANLVLPSAECLNDVINGDFRKFQLCLLDCSCGEQENEFLCSLQRDACLAGCLLNNIPESCKALITNLGGDIISVAEGPLGEAAELVEVLVDAVNCIQSQEPLGA